MAVHGGGVSFLGTASPLADKIINTKKLGASGPLIFKSSTIIASRSYILCQLAAWRERSVKEKTLEAEKPA